MVYTYPYASHQDRSNVVRFNISVNDAIESERYAGLWIRADGKKIDDLEVYNNTVVTRGRHAAYIHADNIEVILRNNIFVSARDGVPLRVDSLTNTVAVSLRDNLYWRGGAPFLVRWSQRELNSLEQLQSELREEVIGPEKLGSFVDPQIGLSSAGIANPLPNLYGLVQFKPAVVSARQGKLTTSAFLGAATRDFLGNKLHPERPMPLGAIGGQY